MVLPIVLRCFVVLKGGIWEHKLVHDHSVAGNVQVVCSSTPWSNFNADAVMLVGIHLFGWMANAFWWGGINHVILMTCWSNWYFMCLYEWGLGSLQCMSRSLYIAYAAGGLTVGPFAACWYLVCQACFPRSCATFSAKLVHIFFFLGWYSSLAWY